MSLIRTYSKRTAKRKAETEEEPDIPKKQKVELQPPPSPPKLARDLSQIFDDATASLTSNKNLPPNKVARRMLRRSKTETSIASEPGTPSSSRIVDKTSSLPSFPSPSKEASSYSLPSSPAKYTDVPPTPSRRTNSIKRTYAGKSRTYLVALPVDLSMTSLEQTIQEEEDEYINRESYNSLRTRWGIDNSEDDPYGPTESAASSVNSTPSKSKGKGKAAKGKGGTDKPLAPPDTIKPFKSITEIRNKGESRRFLDEVGYLLEGMDKEEVPALRRTSALEITNRLCETEFARKAKAADFLLRTWEAFVEGRAGSGEDRVLDTIFAFFYALVARDAGSFSDLVERAHIPTGGDSGPSPFIATVFSLLTITTSDRDLLQLISQSSIPDGQLRKLGLMKSDRMLLKSLYDTILSKSHLFPATHKLSTLSLVTYTLATIAPISLSPAHHLRPLLQSMRTLLIPLIVASTPSNGSNGNSGKPNSTPNDHLSVPDDVPFGAIQDLLGLLDCYLLKRWSNNPAKGGDILEHMREDWLVKGLIGLGISAEVACASVFPQSDLDEALVDFGPASKCIELAFRVLVSLTHADRDWSGSIVRDPVSVTFIIGQVCRADRVRLKNLRRTDGKTGKGKGVIKEEAKEWSMDMMDSDEDFKTTLKNRNGQGNACSQAQALDRLCLALGLLTNIVQEVDGAKDILREAKFDPKCIDQREPCIFSCTCPNSISILKILADVYHHQLLRVRSTTTTAKGKLKRETSPHDVNVVKIPQIKVDVESAEAEADASFLLGHLSVLFGLFMRDNPANQEIIIDALPTETSDRRLMRRAKLDKMVENAKALVKFYATINQAGLDGGDKGGMEDEEPGLSDDARRELGSGDITSGVNIAQGVVSFLEELRDHD